VLGLGDLWYEEIVCWVLILGFLCEEECLWDVGCVFDDCWL